MGMTKHWETKGCRRGTPVQNHLAVRNNDTFYLWTAFLPRSLKPFEQYYLINALNCRGQAGEEVEKHFSLDFELSSNECTVAILFLKSNGYWCLSKSPGELSDGRVKWLVRQNMCGKPWGRFTVPISWCHVSVYRFLKWWLFFPEWAWSEGNTFFARASRPFLLPQESQDGWNPCHQTSPTATLPFSNNLAPSCLLPLILWSISTSFSPQWWTCVGRSRRQTWTRPPCISLSPKAPL